MIWSYYKLKEHGQGPLRQWSVTWRSKTKIRKLRFSIGGYNNTRPPIGNWCLFPRVRVYRPGRYYIHWFNASVFFSPDLYAVSYN